MVSVLLENFGDTSIETENISYCAKKDLKNAVLGHWDHMLFFASELWRYKIKFTDEFRADENAVNCYTGMKTALKYGGLSLQKEFLKSSSGLSSDLPIPFLKYKSSRLSSENLLKSVENRKRYIMRYDFSTGLRHDPIRLEI